MKKIAVVLFAMGGPSSLQEVRPYLFRLFKDPAILRMPWLVRTPLAFLISFLRAKEARKIYAALGGSSPLLKNTKALAAALEQRMQGEDRLVKCFVGMRYATPFAKDVFEEIQNFAPDETSLLPLYPQFSTATSASSLDEFLPFAARMKGKVRQILSYPKVEGFIEALADGAQRVKREKKTRYLFSAHGLPKSIVRRGDPYPTECRMTAMALADKMGLKPEEWVLCFQSKVGPMEWTKPTLRSEIWRAGEEGRSVVVIPISFVSECSETLYELDIEMRDVAQKAGVPTYARTEVVGLHPAFVESLNSLVN